jgi:DNA repair protein RecO (recombination protein O)
LIQRIEGIIFQVLNFQEKDQIIKVFTAEHGLIKLFVKNAHSKHLVSSPLTRAEFIYLEGKTDLWKCQDISLLNFHLFLRQDLRFLQTAFDFISVIQLSQPEQKAVPDLYTLFLRYLEKIPFISSLDLLVSSFRLKILKYEGLFGLQSNCSVCEAPLKAHHVFEGEAFCPRHASPTSIIFSEEEFMQVNLLAHCRHFTELNTIEMDGILKEKISVYFKASFQ